MRLSTKKLKYLKTPSNGDRNVARHLFPEGIADLIASRGFEAEDPPASDKLIPVVACWANDGADAVRSAFMAILRYPTPRELPLWWPRSAINKQGLRRQAPGGTLRETERYFFPKTGISARFKILSVWIAGPP